jgi:hypothetical protein
MAALTQRLNAARNVLTMTSKLFVFRNKPRQFVRLQLLNPAMAGFKCQAGKWPTACAVGHFVFVDCKTLSCVKGLQT